MIHGKLAVLSGISSSKTAFTWCALVVDSFNSMLPKPNRSVGGCFDIKGLNQSLSTQPTTLHKTHQQTTFEPSRKCRNCLPHKRYHKVRRPHKAHTGLTNRNAPFQHNRTAISSRYHEAHRGQDGKLWSARYHKAPQRTATRSLAGCTAIQSQRFFIFFASDQAKRCIRKMARTGRTRTTGIGARPRHYKRQAVSYDFKLHVIQYLDNEPMRAAIAHFFPGLPPGKVKDKRRLAARS